MTAKVMRVEDNTHLVNIIGYHHRNKQTWIHCMFKVRENKIVVIASRKQSEHKA
jgi:hypothetical protein